MATENSTWTTYDGKVFPDEAAATAHETALNDALGAWVTTHLEAYVPEIDRPAAGKIIFENLDSLLAAVRNTVPSPNPNPQNAANPNRDLDLLSAPRNPNPNPDPNPQNVANLNPNPNHDLDLQNAPRNPKPRP